MYKSIRIIAIQISCQNKVTNQLRMKHVPMYIYIAMDQKPWDTVHIQILGIWKYPLVNVYITMENHHFEWKIWDLEIGFDPSRYFSDSRFFPPKPGPVKESPHLDRRSIPRTEWGNSWELHHHFTIIVHGISWGFDIIMGWEKASGNQTWLIMAGGGSLISRSWCFSQIHQAYPSVSARIFEARVNLFVNDGTWCSEPLLKNGLPSGYLT